MPAAKESFSKSLKKVLKNVVTLNHAWSKNKQQQHATLGFSWTQSHLN
jgi:phosphopantetheinyl transferase (holo-ACP synthase)